MKKSLFGYATTTKALAKQGGWDIYDDSFTCKSTDEHLNNLLPSEMFDSNLSHLEIPSPGFPPKHFLIQNAKNLISEYDYLFEDFPLSIWISGTNGKTTTTQMLEFLLQNKNAISGGNIGTPLGDLSKNASIWILETSSFTLHYTKKAYPNIYLLLPITQDHLDWHKDFEQYEQSKLSPLKRMPQGSVCILPSKYKNIKTQAYCIFYDDEFSLAKKLNIDISSLHVKQPFLLDGVLALCCEKILFDKASVECLNNFKIDTHKMQEFYDKKQRLWVNDTKGTNDDATIAALKRYKNSKIHLILGGVDKGLDMSLLFDFISTLNVKIYAIGTTATKITSLCKQKNIEVLLCENIQNAVDKIDEVLQENEVALLSPATSSFDQFKSYKHRGEFFMQCVEKIS